MGDLWRGAFPKQPPQTPEEIALRDRCRASFYWRAALVAAVLFMLFWINATGVSRF